MDTLGTPKLSDYGIARDYSRVVSSYSAPPLLSDSGICPSCARCWSCF
ncbi:hypothetical protein [Tardiphaga robiniae]